MENYNSYDLITLFQRIVHKYNQFESQKRYYGTDMLITVSEIHTIDAIGNHEMLNLINLSKIMGITKGSASQMIYKLVDKGLVNKATAPDSDREIVITLTEKGKKAYEGHKQMHKNSSSKMNSIAEELPQDVINLSIEYMEKLEGALDILIENEQ